MSRLVVAIATVMAGMGQAQADIVVHTSDYVVDAARSHFNRFESLPHISGYYDGGSGPYIEDAIEVRQVNSGSNIEPFHAGSFAGFQGLSWYPGGGDNGYTQIRLADGTDFQDVGFNYATGYAGTYKWLIYELLDGGSVVLSGSAPLAGTAANYLGFSGGGFDTIRMRDSVKSDSSVTDGATPQALAVDNIETVPEPSTLVLWAMLGMVGLRWWTQRR